MADQLFTPGISARILSADTDFKPLWGMMSFHHMVEHLGLFIRVSTGKIKSGLYTREEKLPTFRSFLKSNQPLPRLAKSPLLPTNGLPPLFTYSIADAASELEEEIRNFDRYYLEYPKATEMHPFFGPLDERLWMLFHEKHFQHHFTQFGIVPETSVKTP